MCLHLLSARLAARARRGIAGHSSEGRIASSDRPFVAQDSASVCSFGPTELCRGRMRCPVTSPADDSTCSGLRCAAVLAQCRRSPFRNVRILASRGRAWLRYKVGESPPVQLPGAERGDEGDEVAFLVHDQLHGS